MEATDALDGDDLAAGAAADRRRRRHRRRPSSAGSIAAPGVLEPQTLGPQTGQALGWAWKRRSAGSAYSRRTGRAHREHGHAGVGAVVGDRAQDAQPRAAMGAVGERIAKAPIGGVAHLIAAQAGQVAASGTIPVCTPVAALATMQNAKGLGHRSRRSSHRCAPAAGTQPAGARTGDHPARRAPGPDQHAVAVVAHVARQTQLAADAPDGGPKANTLNQAADPDRLTLGIRVQAQPSWDHSLGGSTSVIDLGQRG
jgi:hypothetical protein